MNELKKIGISLLYMIGILLSSLFLISILHYFNIIGIKMASFFKIFLTLLSMFIGGFISGKRSRENGWLEGLKLSAIILICIILISSLLFGFKIDLKRILFYAIIIGSTTFGSMIGIGKSTVSEE